MGGEPGKVVKRLNIHDDVTLKWKEDASDDQQTKQKTDDSVLVSALFSVYDLSALPYMTVYCTVPLSAS